jgi:two-component system nitrogen regulation sensor histidine kinase NtrY
VRLRTRFALWFALASLLPIVAAALVTRSVLVSRFEQDHRAERAAVEQVVLAELARRSRDVDAAAVALASTEHPFVGGVLRDLDKGLGELDAASQRRTREQAGPVMAGLGLDVLLVTGPGDRVLAAPHFRALLSEQASVARTIAGAPPAFAITDIMPAGAQTVAHRLVLGAARSARDGAFTASVLVGRVVDDDLLTAVRRPGRVDARIVEAGAPPTRWTTLAGDVITVPLRGRDGAEVARVEIVVASAGLGGVLARISALTAILAAVALALTVLVGILVARRITRGLDRLEEAAHVVGQGDLDHRVAVAGSDEIVAVATAFNRMLDELRDSKEALVIAERIAAWQEIARRLAHEIKNPLTPIQMSMDTLRKTHKMGHPQFAEILDESTRTVLEEADRLRRIVSEFSDFARMPKPMMQPLDLSEVVGASLALYGGGPLEKALATGLPPISADRDQLAQVVLNLVGNARDAIADGRGTAITVETRVGDSADRVELRVTDDGPGVAPELRERIFAPYFTTKEGRGGTGLGLAIVHRIVSDHGGRIRMVDGPGRGACVVVELPVVPGATLRSARSTSMRAVE